MTRDGLKMRIAPAKTETLPQIALSEAMKISAGGPASGNGRGIHNRRETSGTQRHLAAASARGRKNRSGQRWRDVGLNKNTDTQTQTNPQMQKELQP